MVFLLEPNAICYVASSTRYVLPVFISVAGCIARRWRKLEIARQLLDLDAVLVGDKMQTKTDVCTVRRLFITSAKEVLFYPASASLSVCPSVRLSACNFT